MTDAWVARRSGRTKHADDARSDHEVDYARIIHSSAFRRLQGKTQILALGEDDFYRTRLTHSLEVSQVAEGVVQQLRHRGGHKLPSDLLPPASLIQAIGLSHDLGHPPFGHGGELALNYGMRDAGGFEGNAQTLRILAKLEPFSKGFGADLTRRMLLGVLKYPVPVSACGASDAPRLQSGPTTVRLLDRDSCKPPKAYYDIEQDVVDWILEPVGNDRDLFQERVDAKGGRRKARWKSFDCSIMDIADDIAYGVHDLEDAIAIGLINEQRFREACGAEVCGELIEALAARPLDGTSGYPYDGLVGALFGEPDARKRAIGRLVHYFLRNCQVRNDDRFAHPLMRHRIELAAGARALLDNLQGLVVSDVIESPRVQRLELKGQAMVVAVFEAFASDPRRLLPPTVYGEMQASGGDLRVLCDHIAAMTDGTLLKTYEWMFSPRMGSLFGRI